LRTTSLLVLPTQIASLKTIKNAWSFLRSVLMKSRVVERSLMLVWIPNSTVSASSVTLPPRVSS
jgi:hypothetical protein